MADFKFLRSSRGMLKILQVVSSTIVMVLLYFGCIEGWKNGKLITLGISGGFLMITTDTIVVYVVCAHAHGKNHLDASISSLQSLLYLSIGIHQMRMAMWWSHERCYTMTAVSGIFAIINTLLYACDAFVNILSIYKTNKTAAIIPVPIFETRAPRS